jgi:predicted ester cyclase
LLSKKQVYRIDCFFNLDILLIGVILMQTILDRLYENMISGSTKLDSLLVSDVKWHVSDPINDLTGKQQMLMEFWQPLITAIPDIERKPFINIESDYQGDDWVASTGYFVGTFSESLFGIPASKKTLYLRFTELAQLQDRKINEYYLILDLIDVMNQVGVNPLRRSLGYSGLVMPPTTMDGIVRQNSPVEEAVQSQQLVEDMLDELGRFDGRSLKSMKLEKFWHPNFMWYGPAGIGTTRGIEGFRANHQGPFVFSFPDRVVDHKATLIADGNYVATGGWPHMHGTHSAGGWLGLPSTGRHLSLRVMDIWRREGSHLRENWVAIDIINMCKQMGLDVFAMMKEQ